MAKIDRSSASGKHGSEAKAWWRGNRIQDIEELCREMGWSIKQMTEYQYRIENVMDVYPTHGRVHDLNSGWRGGYHTARDLQNRVQKTLNKV